jgi:small subunit ribosomal protein S14
MAKKSIVDKNEKRLVKIKRHFLSRKALSEKVKSGKLKGDEIFHVFKRLDKTSNASYIKYRNRCGITGRPRGYRGGVGLSRGALRHYASFGMIVGVKKG